VAVVLDTSIAVKWVIAEHDRHQALRLRQRWTDLHEDIIAPPVFRAELANALYQLTKRKVLTNDEAQMAYRIVEPAVAIRDPSGLASVALTLADRLALPATYDAFYLALSDLAQCECWTADRRLVHAAGSWPRLHLLAEIP
jgi:predicted nucleic acid-binding protein